MRRGTRRQDHPAAPGDDDVPDDELDDGDELDGYRRPWDPVLDAAQDHPVVAGAVGIVLLAAAVVAVVVLVAGARDERVPSRRPATTTTASTTTTTTPGPRPALAALDSPVRPVVRATGRCAVLVKEFRELFTTYPSGSRLDQAGNDGLNRLLPRLDADCDRGTARRFRNLELEVWLRHRPVELPPGVTTTTTAPDTSNDEAAAERGATGPAARRTTTTTSTTTTSAPRR